MSLEISFASVVLTLLLCYLLYRAFGTKRYDPPLPPPAGLALPVVGHFYKLKPDMRTTFKELRARYGDVYFMQLGSVPAVVVSGFSTFREGFKNSDQFNDRLPLFVLYKVTRGGKGK